MAYVSLRTRIRRMIRSMENRTPSHALLCVSFGGAMVWLRAGVAEISGQFPLFAVYRLKSVLLAPERTFHLLTTCDQKALVSIALPPPPCYTGRQAGRCNIKERTGVLG